MFFPLQPPSLLLGRRHPVVSCKVPHRVRTDLKSVTSSLRSMIVIVITKILKRNSKTKRKINLSCQVPHTDYCVDPILLYYWSRYSCIVDSQFDEALKYRSHMTGSGSEPDLRRFAAYPPQPWRLQTCVLNMANRSLNMHDVYTNLIRWAQITECSQSCYLLLVLYKQQSYYGRRARLCGGIGGVDLVVRGEEEQGRRVSLQRSI